MGQDAVYFYNYQQDNTYGTPCHLEKSDLSAWPTMAEDRRQITEDRGKKADDRRQKADVLEFERPASRNPQLVTRNTQPATRLVFLDKPR